MEFIEVEKVETKKYKGKVYDLSIPVDHSYRINKFTVHNSAGGSLIAMAIGLTKLDPIKHGLLFERFVSESRLPDCVVDYLVDDKEI